jgi:DNA-binding Lrp family transcriptional regulator
VLILQEILDILAHDGRITIDEIAVRLGRTESEIREKVAELEKQGIIVSYGALVNWEKMGDDKVFAFISVEAVPEHGSGFDSVADYISRFPEVHSLYLMSGTADLQVVVEGEDFRAIARFVAEKLAPAPGVRSTSTSFVLKSYKMEGIMLAEKPEDHRLAVSP